MTNNTAARARVAALIYSMVNAIIFGIGLVIVLSVPALTAQAFFWIPTVVLTSFVLAAPLCWLIAPMMMLRYMHAHHFVHAQTLRRSNIQHGVR
jgi:uncharacterized membrane protein YciS (DUF1049 family)